MMPRRTFLTLLTTAFAALALAGGWSPAHAAAADDARTFVQKLADTAMTTVAAKDQSDELRAQKFRELFVETFDLPEIGKLVLGRHWRGATPDQQSAFLKAFEDVQVYTWSKRFKDYSGETLEITKTTQENDGDWQVDSLIRRKTQEPIHVSWRVHPSSGGIKVLDIKVEGASMALTYRSEYSSVLQSNGGKVDALTGAMRAKAEQMRADMGK